MPFKDHGCCVHRHRSSGPFADASAIPSYAPDAAVVPEKLDVNLTLDFKLQEAEGFVKVIFKCNNDTTVRSCVLNAVGFQNVRIEAEGEISSRYDGEKIYLTWPTSFVKDERRSVTVHYLVQKPITGLFFTGPDEKYPNRPHLVTTDHETECARYWLPCVDYPVVRTAYEFHLRLPAHMLAVANGLQQTDITHDDGTKTVHWRLDYPCPSYLVCFAAGELQFVDDGDFQGIPVGSLGPKNIPRDWLERSFKETKSMLKWLSSKLNQPFPFPKYYQVASPSVGGAMENISLVSWNIRYLVDEQLAAERQHIFNLVNIHEMAHSYFGDALVIRHFEHAWLKESWATYIEAVYLQDHLTQADFEWEMLDQAEAYFSEVEQYARPIVTRTYNSSWQLFDAHLYPGGSWRLHMLRQLLGDAAFWQGVQSYVADNMARVVETEDFRRQLEKASGRNLTRFFDTWIYGKGYPVLKGEFNYDTETNEVKLQLEQTQATDHATFALSLEIEIGYETSEGTRETIITTVSFSGDHNQRKAATNLRLQPGTKIKTLRVDPQMKLLFSLELNPGEDILAETLRTAPDVLSRVRALRELVKIGNASALQKVSEAMKTEKFYGVRVKAAEALENAHSIAAARILADLLDQETHPLALSTIASRCGLQERVLHEALHRLLKRPSLPYIANANALHALGKHKVESDLSVLIEAALDDAKVGQHGLVRAGALRGLGEHAHEKALLHLRSRLAYGVEIEGIRAAVVGAYAKACTRAPVELRRQAADDLANLLRDPLANVRDAAADALVTLGAAHKANEIEQLKSLTAAQDFPDIDRRLRDLRAQAEGTVPEKVKAELEELQKLVRKLADQVLALETKSK